ncbi:MAG TPA: hypothetical protein VF746_22355 [Longimicrobium sp.]|jgi:hypothetical protein
MTRLPRTALFLLLAALALAGRPAAAQDIRSPLRYIEEAQGLSFFAGYLFSDPRLTLSDTTSVELGPRSAPMFGARYQLRASGPISVNLTAAFIPSERRLFLAEATNDSTEIRVIDPDVTISAPIALAEAGLTFGLTGPRAWNGIAPYVGVSAGLAAEIGGGDDAEDDVPETERFDFGPAFALGLRAGTDVFVTRRAAIRVELGGRLWRQSAPEGFRRSGQAEINEWNNASSIQVGGVFHF